MRNEFFAVTKTSVYHAAHEERNVFPRVEKIALKGESVFPVGYMLSGGTMLAICKDLIMYVPEGGGLMNTTFERRIEYVNTYFWGDKTSSIIALFKTKEEAIRCFNKDNLIPCDPRWLKETREVLGEIGENHPRFEICHYPALALIS
jgi:hypothetical protein